jgi:hypothetical protein
MDAIKVTTTHDGRNRCHHREASKLLRNEPLKREEEGRGDQLRSHKRPCQQAQQERREGVVSITTKLIARQQLSLRVCQSLQNKHDEHSHEAR